MPWPVARISPDGARRAARLGQVEGVHQMRVAASAAGDIGTFEPLIDAPWGARWSAAPLARRPVGRGARPRRSLRWPLRCGPAGRPDAAAHRHRAREAAREELMGALEGSRYLDLLERLVQAARDPLLTAEAQRPASDVVPDLLSGTANRTRGRLKDVLPTALIGRTTRRESAPRTCAMRPRRSVRSSPAARGAFATAAAAGRAGRARGAPGRPGHAAPGPGDDERHRKDAASLRRGSVRRAPRGSPAISALDIRRCGRASARIKRWGRG